MGDSPRVFAPIFSGLAQKIDIQPYWLSRFTHKPNPNPLSHPEAGQTIDNGHSHPLQTQILDKSSSNLAQHRIVIQQWIAQFFQNSSGIFREFVSKIETAHLLKRHSNLTPGKELFLLDRRKPRMARKPEFLQFVNQG